VLRLVGLRNSVSTGWFISQVRAAVLIEWVGDLEPLLHNPAGLPGSKISALSRLVNTLLSHVHAFTCAANTPDLTRKNTTVGQKIRWHGIHHFRFYMTYADCDVILTGKWATVKRAINFHRIPSLGTRGAKPSQFRNLTRCLNQYWMRRKMWDVNTNWERRVPLSTCFISTITQSI